MTDDTDQPLDRILSAYCAGRTLAFHFDYDGTLVPIVEHPRLAVLPPEARDVLQKLAALPRVFVGIVSGRSLDDLKAIVGIPAPDLGWTKGTAVRLFCDNVETEVLPLYAGDHKNDVDARSMATSLGGVSIGVGPHAPSSAGYRLAGPAALIRWLHRVLAALAPHA